MRLKQMTLMWAVIAAIFCLAGCAAIREQVQKNKLKDDSADYRGLSKREVAEYNANPENEDKIVCKTEKPIGSNIPQRICRKESQIRERSDEDQRDMEAFQRHTPPKQP